MESSICVLQFFHLINLRRKLDIFGTSYNTKLKGLPKAFEIRLLKNIHRHHFNGRRETSLTMRSASNFCQRTEIFKRSCLVSINMSPEYSEFYHFGSNRLKFALPLDLQHFHSRAPIHFQFLRSVFFLGSPRMFGFALSSFTKTSSRNGLIFPMAFNCPKILPKADWPRKTKKRNASIQFRIQNLSIFLSI